VRGGGAEGGGGVSRLAVCVGHFNECILQETSWSGVKMINFDHYYGVALVRLGRACLGYAYIPHSALWQLE
jgi:hypothetical protein